MKKGKFILGAAAIVVTATSVFAFKSHRVLNAKHIYGYTSMGGSGQHCKVSASCFTTKSSSGHAGNGGVVAVCHTAAGNVVLTKGAAGTLWTAKTAGGVNCGGNNVNYTKTH